jgi:UDP-N-acetylmuramoylalanine--D-glutamate ligase
MQAPTLEEAIAAARACAGDGDVVLFSPGSPSYDQFVNYEARGESFSRLVRAMS